MLTQSGCGLPSRSVRHGSGTSTGHGSGAALSRSFSSMTCWVPTLLARNRPSRIQRLIVSGLRPTLRAAWGTVSIVVHATSRVSGGARRTILAVKGTLLGGGAIVFVLFAAGPAAAQGDAPSCVGETESDAVARAPGPLLRFGIGPLAQAGQVGPAPGPAVPEQPDRTHATLARLKPATGAFVLRLNRFFWSDGEEGIRRYLALAERFTSRGYLVELQVRYHPNAGQEGDIAAWTEHVREVVRRFGTNPRVIGLQIANEVNLTFSPDSSDGSYDGAREALVRGVIAAKDEARRQGNGRLEVGFNWAYRTDPASEESFWRALRDRGGAEFVRAVDWIGLDAYPGTVFPPAEADLDGYRDGMVNAMSSMRCFARIPGIPPSVPMKVEENGWPTFPGRSQAMQADVLREMVRAVHDFRGTYGVTDYRWFNLRDGDSSSPMPFQHFGLLHSGYGEKPAFEAYRGLVTDLHRPEAPAPGRPRARISLRLSFRRARGRRCTRGPVRATVRGRDTRLISSVRFFVGERRLKRILVRRLPISRIVIRPRRVRARGYRVRAGLRLMDGRLVRLGARFRGC